MTYHIQGMLAPHGSVRAIGQLSMDPQTQAALQACSDNCEKQYGASSGQPDVFQIGLCFANCNLQYPPTLAVPGGGTVTPPPLTTPLEPGGTPSVPGTPGTPGAPIDPVEFPPETPGAPATAKTTGGDAKMWVIGGAVALLLGGFVLYKRKR